MKNCIHTNTSASKIARLGLAADADHAVRVSSSSHQMLRDHFHSADPRALAPRQARKSNVISTRLSEDS